MAAHGKRVTVGSSPVLIAESGCQVVIRNRDATNDVELGGANVAVGQGFRVLHTDTVPHYIDCESDDLYAIAVAGSPVIDVLVLRGDG